MQNSIKIILCLFAMIISGSNVMAQVDIIITPNDTLRNMKVLTSKDKTNAKKVSFADWDGVETSLTSNEVVGYYRDDKLYKSKKVNYPDRQSSQEFVELIFNGDVDLYHVKKEQNGKWQNNYIMSNEEDTLVTSLFAHKKHLDNFFSYHLPRFEEFKETDSFKKKIRKVKYSYSSLATFTSYYNNFINPEKYKATKYRKKVKIGYLIGLAAIGVVTVVSINVIEKAKEGNEPVI